MLFSFLQGISLSCCADGRCDTRCRGGPGAPSERLPFCEVEACANGPSEACEQYRGFFASSNISIAQYCDSPEFQFICNAYRRIEVDYSKPTRVKSQIVPTHSSTFALVANAYRTAGALKHVLDSVVAILIVTVFLRKPECPQPRDSSITHIM